MADINPQPFPPRVVTVQVPRDAFYDLKKMQQITQAILKKRGCPTCHSGEPIQFVEMTQFAVNPATLDVHELAIGGA
jgi:hypothetical protein